jgi:hypothetical protein
MRVSGGFKVHERSEHRFGLDVRVGGGVDVNQSSESQRFGRDVRVRGNLSGVLGVTEQQKSTCLHEIKFEA